MTRRPRTLWIWGPAWLVVLLVLAGCGDRGPDRNARGQSDPGPVHVHGLGVNPADGALFIATHTGLFRAASGERTARRVAGRYQDTMGFTVTGPDRFLGSGHPDPREKLPPFLGLIESRDAGESWQARSLQGRADFHVLEARGQRVYAYGSDWETRRPQFLTSADGGRRWDRLNVPEPLISLAISPSDPRRLTASGERRVFVSRDGGRSWKRENAPAAGLLAWNARCRFLVGLDGRVWSGGAGKAATWKAVGGVGGQPAAFDRGRAAELLVALHDGTIKQSTDGGLTWTVRSGPV